MSVGDGESATFSSRQRDPLDGQGSPEVRVVFTAPPGRLGAPDMARRFLRTMTGGLGKGSAEGIGFRSRTAPFMAG